MYKNFISMLIALQLIGSTLIPTYAANDEAVNFNETYISASDEVSLKGSDRIIIKFKNDKTNEHLKNSKNKKIKSKIKEEKDFKVKNKRYSVVTVNENENIDEIIQSIGDVYSEEIEMVQQDYLIGSFSKDSDAAVENIGEDEESDIYIETAEKDIIVAVIDTAIDYDHEALVDSIYNNKQEEADGIDNDGNGFVDDIIGWDFINGTDMSQSEITSNHGTHVSGLIAADGVGAGTDAKILPLNVFSEGVAYTSDIIEAIEYAEQAGAKIVNCSWGSTAENKVLKEIIENSEMLFVCAAGNENMCIDENPVYPAAYDLDNVIAVGASNDRDYMTYFSNYGNMVDVAANGYNVRSTFVNNSYGNMTGTSMSAAYVSGVAAQVYAGSATETKELISNTSNRISTLTDKVNGGRRINYENTVNGIVNDSIIENTNIDYDTERMNEIISSSDAFELYDLDPEAAKIYAGLSHSVVVNNWGMVNTYGDNTYKQLGQIGDLGLEDAYHNVKGLYSVSKVSTFADHNLALMDGAVYAWGRNNRYQLGHINGVNNAVPTQVEFFNEDGTVPTIIDVAAGGWFSMALDSDGNLWAWGDNTYGQIATGHAGDLLSKPRIIMTGVSNVSAGKYHALAVKDDVVYGWGRNAEDYPLTDAASWSQSTPIEIVGLTGDIYDIEAGDRCSFFITSDGVYALGLNNTGQLGDGTTTTRNKPVLLEIGAGSIESIESNGSTLFRCQDGTVYACGANNYGQIGQGYANTRIQTPVKIPGENYDQIASGGYHNLLFKCNEEYPSYELCFRNARIYATGCSEKQQCIGRMDKQFVYPTIVYEVENTDDTGDFSWDSTHLRPIDATYISQNDTESTENFYGKNHLEVRYTNRESGTDDWGEYSYLKFDVGEIQKECVASAKLYLYVENEGDMRKSTREIGVYDTYENEWNGQEMTWSDGRERARTLLGSFTVKATGAAIDWDDIGWHEVDITDYLKNDCIDDALSLMLKMKSEHVYKTVITSGIYNESFTARDMRANKNIPVLAIEYESEDTAKLKRFECDVLADTYISQHDTEYSTNFCGSEYISVNYTPDNTGNNYWGQDGYLAFDMTELNGIQRKDIESAALWVYVDGNSDIRRSLREIMVFANYDISYDSSIITWEDGRLEGVCSLGTFNVEGNGYEVLTPGWRKIDITDYLKSTTSYQIDFILKMTSGSQHPVKIRSSEYPNEKTHPRLVIDIPVSALTGEDEVVSPVPDNFDIYEFDADVNVYKESILNICNALYYNDLSAAKQMYSEYEDILDDDAKLHTLPESLSDHPKDLEDFDSLLNQYYVTKYDEFLAVKKRYIALIDKYSENSDAGAVLQNAASLLTSNEEAEERQMNPIIGKYYPQSIRISDMNSSSSVSSTTGKDIAGNFYSAQQETSANEPSLTIVETTSTSITYEAVFPVSGEFGNSIYIVDFNTDDGLTDYYNLYDGDFNRNNGRYTISGLKPGGIYFLNLCWLSDDGVTIGGENHSIYRYVKLPDSSPENLILCSGERVTARIEEDDINLASSSDFNTWLNRMDQAYYTFKDLTGYTPFDSKKIEMRSTREDLNGLFEAVDGLDYWWVYFGYYDSTNIFKHSRVFNQGHMRRLSMGDWGDTPMHELSHVFDNENWIFDSETLAQLKLYYVVEQLDAKVYRPDRFDNNGKGWYTGGNYYDLLKHDRYLDSYDASFGNGTYESEGFAAILIEIQKEIGWEPFKKTFRYFGNLNSSQVPRDYGEILKLFLTKLKDYSGEDVLSYISSRDIGIIESHFAVNLEYVEPIYPTVSGGSSGGGHSEITADKGNSMIYQFTPNASANYYIYTSPYGGSGASNDTYIEIYTNSSLSGTPIASNDDYDGGRFSKVNVAMTGGTTYYIKVRHYKNGQLHAELNITKNVPVTELSPDSYEDIGVADGESALYSFTPAKSITYVFEVGNYNGGTTEYDTYIKLYGNESMTQRIGTDNKKIIVNLIAGHTYYLQFSGFLMKSSRGRIRVREGQTIEFSKRTDSSFIYVNSPEYLTRIDIVDDECHKKPLNDKKGIQPYLKIFEQENVTGKNTFYETHTAWYGLAGQETYYPKQQFYIDVDMYNPTNQAITVSIENLAYGIDYSVLQQYYNGGYNYEFTIQPHEHVPIFSYLDAPLLCTERDANSWARIPVILFDFTVHSGNVTVSSIAAYNRSNLYLRNGTKNVVNNTNAVLDTGEVIYDIDENGNTAWYEHEKNPRPNETDLYSKIKGIAKNESAWIDANIELVVDSTTNLGTSIPITLKDDYYTYGIANPKWSWMPAINPLNDLWDGVLLGLPRGLHNFQYHYGETNRQWCFDFWHRDLRYADINGTGTSVNNEVPADIRENAKLDMAAGIKNHFPNKIDPLTGDNLGCAPDEYSMGIGEWGATYHYTVTVVNTTDFDRTIYINTWSAENLICGVKKQGEKVYTTQYYTKIENIPDKPENTAIVSVPANGTTTFEFVTLLGGGLGGLSHSIVIE